MNQACKVCNGQGYKYTPPGPLMPPAFIPMWPARRKRCDDCNGTGEVVAK